MGLRKWIAIFVFVSTAKVGAQHFGSIANGNYSGVHAAKINPALTAYSEYDWHINVIGAWANINNNYLTLRLPYSAYRLTNNSMPSTYISESGNPTWNDNWLAERTNGRPKHVAIGAILYAPSFTIKIKKYWHVGLLTDATALARISGVGENLAHALYKQLDTAKRAFSMFNGQSNKIHKMTISANAYASVGLNVSKDIPLDHKQHLLIGGSLKREFGFGGGYFQSGNMVQTTVNKDSVTLDRSNISFAGYSGIGKGWGVDIGVGWVYVKPEYRQPGGYKEHHTKYLFKFGASILDIGSIKYTGANVTTIINNHLLGWNVADEKQKWQGATIGVGAVEKALNTLPNIKNSTQDLRIGLPTRLALTADYQFMPDIFVNMQLVQSLRGRYSISARQQSYIMVAPRWEKEFFEFSLPMMLEYDYRAFRVGAAFRVGPLYFGTNSLYSFINTKNVRDADFFIGIAFGNLPGNWKSRWLKAHPKKKEVKAIKDCEKM